ncbi:MAG: NAD(P)H-dependent oxidoreductase [Gemmobacter sp.]|uniref:NAD(P)H-dependent oxidoreductase n=1 Tax=Gemmobacter sp. TaxID=1898957 RepID=UPI001A555624|nr:NAD(P)H-dependent oxidoreductase [Gemmobacter sp.]MBL8563540.1 NAD(P)H-dependent oxidoreductase [Gemmobacter sp.]
MASPLLTTPAPPRPLVLGLSGNITAPSKTRALVATALDLISARLDVETDLLDITDFGPALGPARHIADLPAEARAKLDRLLSAEALVLATPIYKASYPGLFKHLIDLLDPDALRGKPVLLAATGGGEKHALVVEHQLRPLLAFFEAQSLATAVHASDKDFTGGALTGAATQERLARAVAQFDAVFPTRLRLPRAAA